MPYTYKYPRPALTTDCIIFLRESEKVKVLLIKRKNPPFQNMWAFPGGFVDIDEEIETAAYRELEEETGLKNIALREFKTVGTPGRDPRGRVVTVFYAGFTTKENSNAQAADDAESTHWFSINEIPNLAFDHSQILQEAILNLDKLK